MSCAKTAAPLYIHISQRNKIGHTHLDVTRKTRALSTCHDNNTGSDPIPTSVKWKKLNKRKKSVMVNPYYIVRG